MLDSGRAEEIWREAGMARNGKRIDGYEEDDAEVTRHVRMYISVLMMAMAGISCTEKTIVSPGDGCVGVPEWANPIEPGCWPWEGGGPEQPMYGNHQDEPDWSKQGLIVYRDYGVVDVDMFTGYRTVDSRLQGIWIVDPRDGGRYRVWASGRNPRWSPSGQEIVFVDNNQVCVVNYKGGQYRQLTPGGWNNLPVWSGDGRMLAYESNWESTNGYEIWIMYYDTMIGRSIANGGCAIYDWLWDSEHMLMSGGGDTGRARFSIVDTSGTNVETLWEFANNVYVERGRLCPDGRHIAYTKRVLGYCKDQIWIMDPKSGIDYRVTWEGGSWPAWSPDGTMIVYVKEDVMKHDRRLGTLWIMNMATGKEWQLTHHWMIEKGVR